MKKIMLALVAATGVITAQSQYLSFGPTAGFGSSWADISNDISADARFHPYYNAGGKLVYSIKNHFGISADVKFSSEGRTRGTDADNRNVIRANYIRVPIQGIYFFNDYGDAIRPKISIGPSFGFLVGGKTKTYINDEVVSEFKTDDIANGFDFGLTGAIGANFRIAEGTWLNADIAYYHGLSDFAKDNIGISDAHHRNIGLNVGILFPIGEPRKK